MARHEQAHRIAAPNGARIAVTVAGEGPALVLLPSLGRGAEDFDALVPPLAAAGHRVIRPQPRWVGDSTGPVEGKITKLKLVKRSMYGRGGVGLLRQRLLAA